MLEPGLRRGFHLQPVATRSVTRSCGEPGTAGLREPARAASALERGNAIPRSALAITSSQRGASSGQRQMTPPPGVSTKWGLQPLSLLLTGQWAGPERLAVVGRITAPETPNLSPRTAAVSSLRGKNFMDATHP